MINVLDLNDDYVDRLARVLHEAGCAQGVDKAVAAIASDLRHRPAGVEFLVAVAADAVAGFASYSMLYPSTGAGLTALLYLKELYVVVPFRRQGIATLLIGRIAQIASLRNCPRVAWTVSKQNTAAQALYDSLGAQRADWLLTYRLSGEALGKLAGNDAGASVG